MSCSPARSNIPARDFAAMQALVIRCAEIHLEHIRTNGDPFEYGRARPLDFGHWSAHKLELLSGFRISHGEAVAAGVLLDSIYAQKKGWITAAELAPIRDGLQPQRLPALVRRTRPARRRRRSARSSAACAIFRSISAAN